MPDRELTPHEKIAQRIHLNKEQADALRDLLQRIAREEPRGERPSSQEHLRVCDRLLKVPAPKPSIKIEIPGARKAAQFGWSAPLFQLRKGERLSVPPGLALVPIYTSEASLALHNAAESLWVHMWNMWHHSSHEEKMRLIALCARDEN